ncbi:MAG: iron-containing alcohol dehydrogenase [Candidatus Humimicrobiaceae bacterium]
MENFEFHCFTKYIFGKGTENQVGEEVKRFGSSVLLVYGGGSIKEFGLYDKVIKSLKDQGIKVTELSGVKPNPTYDSVYKGIELARDNNVDTILAVGGGSVIDASKAIAVGIPYEGDVVDFAEQKATPKESVPIGVILTIPAAGSESSQYAVVSYKKDGYLWKRDVVWENFHLIRPQFAILNPELTFTLPPFQTACGIVDIMGHTMERFFTSVKNVELTDRMSIGLLKTVINNGRIVMDEPENYDGRAEIMWAGALAQNDLLGTGRANDFSSHMIEHEISGIYDIAHGAGLAIIYPAWMKYVYKYNRERFLQYATEVWNVDHDFYDPERTILEGIRRQENFYKELGLATRLSGLNIPEDRFEEMAEKAVKAGSIKKLTREDIINILNLAK